MIISVLNKKGGAGKTTLATNLAVAFRKDDKSVMIIDSDGVQASSMYWHGRRDEKLANIDCVNSYEKDSLRKTLKSFNDKYDVIIIDGAPLVNEVSTVAISMSDLVLVPSVPSGADAYAASLLVSHIENIMEIRPDLKAAFVMNNVGQGTNIAKEIRVAYTEKFTAIPVLATELNTRVSYREAISYGQGVLETLDFKAQEEMASLYLECLNLISLEPTQ